MSFNRALKFAFLLCNLLLPTALAGLPDIVEKIKQSTVAVGTFMASRSPKSLFLGTGFVVADGHLIATNAHVLATQLDTERFEHFAVFFRDQNGIRKVNVKPVIIDKIHDLALLEFPADPLPALLLNQDTAREGQLIAFTGFPIGMVLGLYPVTHQGIISAISPIALPVPKSKQLNSQLIHRLKASYLIYQLDATAYPGNSGSPVYDRVEGQVIGIINKVFVKESKETILSKPSGITYAIPVRYLVELLQRYKTLQE